MIMDSDIQGMASLDNGADHFNIVLTGARIATWVIVDPNERAGANFQDAVDDFAWVNGGVIDGTALIHFFTDQMIFVVKEQ
jgi:uncharacterized protein (DUF433 family)